MGMSQGGEEVLSQWGQRRVCRRGQPGLLGGRPVSCGQGPMGLLGRPHVDKSQCWGVEGVPVGAP